MPKGVPNPVCMECAKRPAVWPKTNPMFCTVTCAAKYGVGKGDEKTYCRTHKQWYYFDESCPDCPHEF